MNKTENFITNDFPLAVSLLCSGLTIIKLSKAGQNRVSFVFEKSEETERVVQAFWNDELRVEPKGFFNKQKELKARIYSCL